MDITLATPIVNAETEYYWDKAEQGELQLPWCEQCARYVFYPRSFCPYCWGESVRWRLSAGKGSVYSYTVIRRIGFAPFDELVPYVLAIIHLEEGVRMLSHVRGVDPAAMAVGMPVEVSFEDIGGGRPVPLFRPASGHAVVEVGGTDE